MFNCINNCFIIIRAHPSENNDHINHRSRPAMLRNLQLRCADQHQQQLHLNIIIIIIIIVKAICTNNCPSRSPTSAGLSATSTTSWRSSSSSSIDIDICFICSSGAFLVQEHQPRLIAQQADIFIDLMLSTCSMTRSHRASCIWMSTRARKKHNCLHLLCWTTSFSNLGVKMTWEHTRGRTASRPCSTTSNNYNNSRRLRLPLEHSFIHDWQFTSCDASSAFLDMPITSEIFVCCLYGIIDCAQWWSGME